MTIPRALREQFGLHPATEVAFEATPTGVLIRPATAARRRKLEQWLKRARGSATTRRSTGQIMRLTRGEG